MRRLVDIDEVIKVAENAFPQEDVRKIMWVLCHTPTAYDVEKVVAELEQALGNTNFEKATSEVNESYYNGLSYAYGEAIDIVRRGGVE